MRSSQEKLRVRELTICAVFTAMIAVGAFIKIPIPVVPFTLQFLFTTLAGSVLGSRLGFWSVAAYILLGLVGLPIFAEGGGLFYVFKPTFGYIIGFALAAYVTGKMVEDFGTGQLRSLLLANFAGLGVVYLMGMAYYYALCNYVLNTPIGMWPLFLYCFLLAVPGDIVLCIVSAFLTKRLRPVLLAGGLSRG